MYRFTLISGRSLTIDRTVIPLGELIVRRVSREKVRRGKEKTEREVVSFEPSFFPTTYTLLSGIQHAAHGPSTCSTQLWNSFPRGGDSAVSRFKLKACSCRAGTSLVVLFPVYYLPTSLARLPNGRRIKRGREERGWKGMGDCKFRELGYLRCALVKRKKRKKEKELFLSLLTGYWKNKTKASLITPLAKDARIYFYALRIREISSRNIGYRYLGCFTSCL